MLTVRFDLLLTPLSSSGMMAFCNAGIIVAEVFREVGIGTSESISVCLYLLCIGILLAIGFPCCLTLVSFVER